ncbi:predicted protein [Chaetoceros tenuissimus]|uniref:Uncharacterized protein n=1 Tax=Chaetoceros tenuissimus TaxID=426638 RepID=A0AAD3H3N5_9STRA|nr:predicted protein [Chaetoceros tenuissimus]
MQNRAIGNTSIAAVIIQEVRRATVYQTGTSSIIVFRVTVGTNQLTNSAAEISEEMFSTASNMITLVSQMMACSFDHLIFAPSTSSSFSYGEDGVVGGTFTSDILQTHQATDVEIVKTLYGSDMNEADNYTSLIS